MKHLVKVFVSLAGTLAICGLAVMPLALMAQPENRRNALPIDSSQGFISGAGVAAGNLDLNGNRILTDADGTSWVQSDVNDQIALAPNGGVAMRISATSVVLGAAVDVDLRTTGGLVNNSSNTTVSVEDGLDLLQATIAADDATPSVAGAVWFTTSANVGATAITDLDDPTPGQIVCIIGGSATNSSTIADSGNFNLTAAYTAAVDDVLCLYVQADNDYIEIMRANN